MRKMRATEIAAVAGGTSPVVLPKGGSPGNGPTLVTAPNLTGTPVTLLNNSDYGVTGQIVKGKGTITFTNHNTGLTDTFTFNQTGAADTFGGSWGNLGWGVTLTGSGHMSLDLTYSLNDTSAPGSGGNYIISGGYSSGSSGAGSGGYGSGYAGGGSKSNYSHDC